MKIKRPTLSGPTRYLGHFAGEKVLREGHNTHEKGKKDEWEHLHDPRLPIYGDTRPGTGAIRETHMKERMPDEHPDEDIKKINRADPYRRRSNPKIST